MAVYLSFAASPLHDCLNLCWIYVHACTALHINVAILGTQVAVFPIKINGGVCTVAYSAIKYLRFGRCFKRVIKCEVLRHRLQFWSVNRSFAVERHVSKGKMNVNWFKYSINFHPSFFHNIANKTIGFYMNLRWNEAHMAECVSQLEFCITWRQKVFVYIYNFNFLYVFDISHTSFNGFFIYVRTKTVLGDGYLKNRACAN